MQELLFAENPKAVKKKVWEFGKHKSKNKWENQMKERGWDEKSISETIKNRKQIKAINKVNPKNTVTKYINQKTKKYVVKDDVSNEILQIGGDKFYLD